MPLIPRTRDEVRTAIDALSPEVRACLSAGWLELLAKSSPQDPWVHGFHVMDKDGLIVGIASFKGPPTDGVVEIAYAIVPEQQRKGHATQAARDLVKRAFECHEVQMVCAHTLPDGVASQHVLKRVGFRHVGEVNDPDDGWVWRFEIARSVQL